MGSRFLAGQGPRILVIAARSYLFPQQFPLHTKLDDGCVFCGGKLSKRSRKGQR